MKSRLALAFALIAMTGAAQAAWLASLDLSSDSLSDNDAHGNDANDGSFGSEADASSDDESVPAPPIRKTQGRTAGLGVARALSSSSSSVASSASEDHVQPQFVVLM